MMADAESVHAAPEDLVAHLGGGIGLGVHAGVLPAIVIVIMGMPIANKRKILSFWPVCSRTAKNKDCWMLTKCCVLI